MKNVSIFDNIEAVANAAAENFINIGAEAIAERGRYTVSLSGGSTPKALFRVLTDIYRDKIDWTKILFFFGDERFVPPTSDESNFRTADENLFRPLKIKAGNIFQWATEGVSPDAAAADYQQKLAANFPATLVPRFDLFMLGMGADGHTASLFPHTTALQENDKFAVPNWVPKFDSFRLTMSAATINNAANVMFMIAGADKAEALKVVLNGTGQTDLYPAQLIKPHDGNLFWLVDKAAAELL